MDLPLPTAAEICNPSLDFEAMSARIWEYQLSANPVIAQYCAALGDDRPQFIPIRFFKDFELRCGRDWEAAAIYRSSGTTGQVSSQHLVKDLGMYEAALMAGFHQFYGQGEYTIFALLPSYLERGDSSLVHMVKTWIMRFGAPGSGFYLADFAALQQGLVEAAERRERILLIGVSFALLDFAAQYALQLPPDTIVMETGGMKGRREELTRAALHATLRDAFGLRNIHSEYGMTELLSQAYSMGDERFHCPPWMRIVITDSYIPNRVLPPGQVGRLNVIDLANLHSCAFIATDDLGRRHQDGTFEVLGRMDNAELRGCNLMYQ
jgi:phenylacetate-coenzyme A ligase PaaK-like adenylate-forming protein